MELNTILWRVVNDYNVEYPLNFIILQIWMSLYTFSPIVERLGKHDKGTVLSTPLQQDKEIELAPFSLIRNAGVIFYVLFLTSAERGCGDLLCSAV